jgi:hypothetical protein
VVSVTYPYGRVLGFLVLIIVATLCTNNCVGTPDSRLARYVTPCGKEQLLAVYTEPMCVLTVPAPRLAVGRVLVQRTSLCPLVLASPLK